MKRDGTDSVPGYPTTSQAIIGPKPPLIPGEGQFKFIGYLDNVQKGAKTNGYWPGGHGGGGSDSCRKQGNYEKQLKDHNYGIKARGHVGSRTGKKVSGLKTSITSGGPGSTGTNCCGITVGINNDTGRVFIATEDWSNTQTGSSKKTVLCGEGAKRNCDGDDGTGLGSLYDKDIVLEWHYKKQNGHHIYTGVVNSKTFSITDPRRGGNPKNAIIIPQYYQPGYVMASDPTRFRIDGSSKSTLGRPKVYLE